MRIMKYLDEWMKNRNNKETYCRFLENYYHNGRHMHLGFFCLEDVEPFK